MTIQDDLKYVMTHVLNVVMVSNIIQMLRPYNDNNPGNLPRIDSKERNGLDLEKQGNMTSRKKYIKDRSPNIYLVSVKGILTL